MERDTVDEISRRLEGRGDTLPAGGAAWLRAHPRAAARLLRDVLAAREDQYLRWEYRVATTVWAVDAEEVEQIVTQPLAGERVELVLRWTGRWYVDTVDPDTWIFMHGTEPPSGK